jgi:hypothetical protein
MGFRFRLGPLSVGSGGARVKAGPVSVSSKGRVGLSAGPISVSGGAGRRGAKRQQGQLGGDPTSAPSADCERDLLNYLLQREAQYEQTGPRPAPKDPQQIQRARDVAAKYLNSPQETFEELPPDASLRYPPAFGSPSRTCRYQQGMDDYCYTHEQMH